MESAHRRSRRGVAVSVLSVLGLVLAAGLVAPRAVGAVVAPPAWQGWITTPDQSQLLTPIQPGPAAAGPTLVVDPSRRGQPWVGVGGSMTDASVKLIRDHRQLLDLLFSPTRPDGARLTFVRLPLSATDFSYQSAPGDPYRSRPDWTWPSAASVPAEEQRAVDTVLGAQRLDPAIGVVATAWSAPPSYKSTHTIYGGDLDPNQVGAYARLLLGQAASVLRQGVHLKAMTLGNEPEYDKGNYATMGMDDSEIGTLAHLTAPTLARSGVRLWALDHNWSDWPHAGAELARAPGAFAAAAFHCYGGQPDALDDVTVPGVMTECTGSNDSWQNTFRYADTYIMQTVGRGAIGVLFWNLALDATRGPNNGAGCASCVGLTPGCKACRGLVQVAPDGSLHPQPEFYELAHLSRAAQPGDVRVGLSGPAGLSAVAFQRSDGSVGVFGHNDLAVPTAVTVQIGTQRTGTFSVPAGALFTLRGPASTSGGGPLSPYRIARLSSGRSYYLDGARQKHWIPDGETYLCLTARQVPVEDASAAELEALPTGADQPRCLAPARFEGRLLQAPSGYAYYVSGGVRHWIPDGGTFLCLKAWRGAPVTGPWSWDQVNSIPEDTMQRASCAATAARGTVIREGATAQAWYVDAALTRHWIPDGETYYCYVAHHRLIDDLDADHVNALPSGPQATPCLDPRRFEGQIARALDRPDPKPSYYVSGGRRHWIPDGWTYDYLVRRGVRVHDVATEQAILDSLPRGADEPARIDPGAVPTNRVLRQRDGTAYYLDPGRVRHWIPDGGTYLCLTTWRQLAVIDGLAATQVVAFRRGANQTCSTAAAYGKIIRVGATGAAYYVDGAGVRHWIPNGGTYLCLTAWRGVAVLDNLAAVQVEAFRAGSDATCSVPEARNRILRVAATGAAYLGDGNGVTHWIPNGGTYLCLKVWKGYRVLDGLTQNQVDALPAGGTATCTASEAFNKILRVSSTGAAYLVDGGGVAHWIPNGGTYLCLEYWQGYQVLDNLTPEHIQALPAGPAATCVATRAFNTIVRVGATGASYYVDDSGVRHWIPNGGTFDCFRYWEGAGLYDNLTQPYIDALPAGGTASCVATQAFNTIVRVGATGVSYFVDGSGVRHWIPNGGTFDCLYYWKHVPLYDNMLQQQADAFADGSNASCTATEAFNTIVRVGATGASYLVDGSGVRHWIPNGGTFLCLYDWKGYPLWDNLAQGYIDALPSGGNASCVVSEAFNTVVRETTTGTAYFVDGGGVRHWIQDGATYNCLIKTHSYYHDLTWDQIDAIPEGSWEPKMSC